LKNLIVAADIHLRDNKPRCRPKDEDWFEVQKQSLLFLYQQAEKHKADVCVCGDIFHYETVSNKLLNMCLNIILGSKQKTYILPGQHDLQFHSLDSIDKTSYGVLHNIAKEGNTQLRLMSEIGMSAPFGVDVFEGVENGLYFTHVLTMPVRKNWMGSISGIYAGDLLDKYPKSNVIFCGDNHLGFFYEK
jgi:hypothetical protein